MRLQSTDKKHTTKGAVVIRGHAGVFNRNDLVVSATDYDRLLAEHEALNEIARLVQSMFEDETSLYADRGETTEQKKKEHDMFYKQKIAFARWQLSTSLEDLDTLRKTKPEQNKEAC